MSFPMPHLSRHGKKLTSLSNQYFAMQTSPIFHRLPPFRDATFELWANNDTAKSIKRNNPRYKLLQ